MSLLQSLSFRSRTAIVVTKEETARRSLRYRKTKKAIRGISILFFTVLVINIIEDRYISKSNMDLEYSIIRTLPLKTYSRLQGWLCRIRYPWPLNIAMVGIPKAILRISLKDAEKTKVKEYFSINQLFTRKLATDSRPIEKGLVSPVDGTIIYAGPVRTSSHKIKGINYKEEELLKVANLEDIKKKNGNLYQIIIYLAPNNYHRFHAFYGFRLKEIKHVPLQLFSVSTFPMKYLRGLLSKNERVIFSGYSDWGYLGLVAVGSTGVGSISTPFISIGTNQPFSKNRVETYRIDHEVLKGEELGHFNLGSTVALIFEAPHTLEILRQKGPIKMGETLAHLVNPEEEPTTNLLEESNVNRYKTQEYNTPTVLTI